MLSSKQTALCLTNACCCMQSWTADDGQKDRPKHVKCHSKINKFDTSVHLVGFTVGIILRFTALWRSNNFVPDAQVGLQVFLQVTFTYDIEIFAAMTRWHFCPRLKYFLAVATRQTFSPRCSTLYRLPVKTVSLSLDVPLPSIDTEDTSKKTQRCTNLSGVSNSSTCEVKLHSAV